MASRRTRTFQCNLVNEQVGIALRERPSGNPRSPRVMFVQCDQELCQYVSDNRPPCPLELQLFAEEIEARSERARRRREGAE